jgi:peptide/nickel transport system substrate-binding protein
MQAQRWVAGIITLAIAAFPVSLAVPSAAHAEGSADRTLDVAFTAGIDSLNPLAGSLSGSTQVFRLVYDFLNGRDPRDLSPAPGLAESWATSADGLTWTYKIRRDAKWSDGEPLTAQDIAFTFNLILKDPKGANGNYVTTFESVTAPDPATLRIRTKSPTSTMLALDAPILPAHIWKGIADAAKFENQTFPLVGSGPFQLVEYRPGQYLRLKANKHYWGGAPKVDELVLRHFDNTDAAVEALRKGEIDLLGDMTPAQFDALAGDRHITRNAALGPRFTELAFNNGATKAGRAIGDGNPVLKDRRLRTAIDYAIDKKTLIDKVLGGHGEAGYGYIPPMFSSFAWKPDTAIRRAYDPAKANKILDEAGYRRGADGTRTTPSGKPLKLRLFAPNHRPFYEPATEHIAGWLRQAGIAIEMRMMTPNQLDDISAKGRFDLYVGGWGVAPDPDAALSVQTCTTSQIDAFYCNPAYDQLYRRQVRETDLDKRRAIVRQMQQRLYEDVPHTILFYPQGLEAFRNDRFTGFARRPAVGGAGSVIGEWGYASATPAGGPEQASDERPMAAAAGGLAAAAILGGVFVWWRRRTSGDRE